MSGRTSELGRSTGDEASHVQSSAFPSFAGTHDNASGVSRSNSPAAASIGPVQVRITSFASVEVAVQLAARGVGVALLTCAWPLGRGMIPARPLAPAGRAAAEALLAAANVSQGEFLQRAAELFGVACWPLSVARHP